MKKILLLFIIFFMVGCTDEPTKESNTDVDKTEVETSNEDASEPTEDDETEDSSIIDKVTETIEEVSDIIKLQNANKDIEEIHMETEFSANVATDPNETSGLELNMGFGMVVSMDLSNQVTHTFTTVQMDFFGSLLEIEVEMYSQYEDGFEVTYTNEDGTWRRDVVESEETSPTTFNLLDFTSLFEEDMFEIIEPIVLEDGRELKQMKMTMTGEQLKDTLVLPMETEGMTEEEIASQNEQEVTFIIAYSTETYYIERIEFDLQSMMEEMPEDMEVMFDSVVISLSKHNQVGEIVIPEEVLNA